MKTPFFITGLPRSRTAWLANLFCTDTTVCFHELLAEGHQSISEMVEAFPEVRVGISDSTLVLKFQALRCRWPEAPWLYVQREPADAMRSFMRFTRGLVPLLGREVRRFWEMHQAASEALFKDSQVLVVKYEQLAEAPTVFRSWAHLVPELRFPELRLKVLQNLRIEQRAEQVIRRSMANLVLFKGA